MLENSVNSTHLTTHTSFPLSGLHSDTGASVDVPFTFKHTAVKGGATAMPPFQETREESDLNRKELLPFHPYLPVPDGELPGSESELPKLDQETPKPEIFSWNS